MGQSDPELWNRLMAFQYATPEAGGLVARAMAELGDSKQQARLRVDAYLRFIYLVAVSHETLAPSKQVDLLWHLHLKDGSSYRDGFCTPLVGRVISHHQGRPSAAKDPAYQRTLTRFREEFDRKPEGFFWPRPAAFPARPLLVAAAGGVMAGMGALLAGPLLMSFGFAIGAIGLVVLLQKLGVLPASGGDRSGCGGFWTSRSSGDGDGSSDNDGGCGAD